jgi:hypothetical protein
MTATDRPVPARSRPDLTTRLRGSSMGALVMLILQFALGIGVNLYVSPAKGGIGAAFSNGALLALHAVLGLLLIIAAAGHLVLSVRARRTGQLVLSAVGLIAILVAASGGAEFLSSHGNAQSMGMALAAAVAMLCYAICLRVSVSAGPAGG